MHSSYSIRRDLDLVLEADGGEEEVRDENDNGIAKMRVEEKTRCTLFSKKERGLSLKERKESG